MTRASRGLLVCVWLSHLVGTGAHAELARPRNPWLVEGESSMTHFEPAQQDSVAHAGPAGVDEVGWDRIQRIAGGLGNGVYVNGVPYPDAPGVEVVWIVNASRVAKVRVDGGRWEELARFELPGQPQIGAAEADRITTALDEAKGEEDLVAFIRAEYPYWLERVVARSGVYSMMDRDGRSA